MADFLLCERETTTIRYLVNMEGIEHPTSWNNVSVGISSRGKILVVVESCVFLVLDLTALAGNTLVCVALHKNISLRTITNNFILSLVLTDLLMAILVIPLCASASLADEEIGGSFGLVVYGYVGPVLAETSILTVMLQATNRSFRVVRPTLYCTIYSKKSSAVMAVTILIVCVGWQVSGLEFRSYPANPTIIVPVYSSASTLPFYRIVRSAPIVVSGLVITSCYVKIYQTNRHHNTAAAPSSQGGHSSYGVEEAKIMRMLTVVLIGFYLCYVPPFVSIILYSLTLVGDSSRKYVNVYVIFPIFASSVINPLIYATMSRPFKNGVSEDNSIWSVIWKMEKLFLTHTKRTR